MRDAAGGIGAGLGKTALLHPLDSVKTRWQLGQPAWPAEQRLSAFAAGLYRGANRPVRGVRDAREQQQREHPHITRQCIPQASVLGPRSRPCEVQCMLAYASGAGAVTQLISALK